MSLGTQPASTLPATTKAKLAIDGMLPDDVQKKVEALQQEMPDIESGSVWERSRRRKQASELLAQQVEILALAYAKAQSDLRATASREQFYAEYTRLSDQLREMQKFLREHFPDELEKAIAIDMPLLNMVKGLMLELKKRAG